MSHPDRRAGASTAGEEWLPRPVRTAVFALGVQSGLGLWYLASTGAGVAAPTTMAVPLVWVTAAVVAVVHVDGPALSGGRRALAAAVAVGYAVGLAWVAGLVSPAGSATGLSVAVLPPWWGPVLRYGGWVTLTLPPFRVVGYGALGYLVYATVGHGLSGRRGLLGVVGPSLSLLSCVGCAAPLLSALGVVGGTGAGGVTALVAGSGVGPHVAGTVAYLLAVGLLAAGTRWSG